MECNEALILLSGHIDKANTEQEEAALQAHLAECADCRALLKAYEDIDEGVAELSVPAPEGLVSAVMEKIGTPAKKTRSPWRSIGVSAGLVAAVLVLLVGTKTIKLPDVSDNRAAPRTVTQAAAEKTAGEVAPEAAPQATDAQVPTEVCEPAEDLPGLQAPTRSNQIPATEPSEGDGKTAYESDIFKRHDVGGHPLTEPTFPPELLEQCASLSEDSFAAVLLYDGIDAEFFDWLKEQEPELAERFETNAVLTTDEETGHITVMSDYSTVMALHEWLLSQMCAGTDPVQKNSLTEELADKLTAQALEELGLDKELAERVYSFPAPEQPIVWPERWAKDFTLRWLTGESWQLFYPEEEYLPEEEDLAFLILIPPIDEDEAIR